MSDDEAAIAVKVDAVFTEATQRLRADPEVAKQLDGIRQLVENLRDPSKQDPEMRIWLDGLLRIIRGESPPPWS